MHNDVANTWCAIATKFGATVIWRLNREGCFLIFTIYFCSLKAIRVRFDLASAGHI